MKIVELLELSLNIFNFDIPNWYPIGWEQLLKEYENVDAIPPFMYVIYLIAGLYKNYREPGMIILIILFFCQFYILGKTLYKRRFG